MSEPPVSNPSMPGSVDPLRVRPRLHALAKVWWLFLLRGIAAILFGALAFAWPGLAILSFVLLYGAFALVDGIFALVAAIRGRGSDAFPTWWLVLVGLAGVAAGIATAVWPGITALVLVSFIGAWALVRGIFEIVGAIQLRKEIDNEWWLVASGVLSVLFGVVVLAAPGAAAVGLIWTVAAFSIITGVALIAFSLRLRKHADHG